MKLEDIGFYTLSDKRAKTSSINSPLMRGELILTDRCNLKCPYCRGLKKELQGDISLPLAQYIISVWQEHKIQNIRFSGGEPTLYPHLLSLVKGCKNIGIKRIAISTNGTASLSFYDELIENGVDDFSISLDAGCCSIGDVMCGGVKQAWEGASKAIKYLSKKTYVTVGVVFNEKNISVAKDTILYCDSLHPSDIRIIPSTQYNKAIDNLVDLPINIVKKYPILNYRINRLKNKLPIRGVSKGDSYKCRLVLDDIAVAQNYAFPCIIYLREGGKPISLANDKNFREKRLNWYKNYNTYNDTICKKNCIDVCIEHNNLAIIEVVE